ncbi:MAG: 3-methyl-2-oxobutanoate dehydrogenase subunit VorB [Thermoanaerobaculaceae bacterium]|jgi:2-oxoglutarate ferredoxin oxidoreductase subunit alpha|nr:3-methyl-2-oxobutanoate dehydrogenase subunit VorB [Thermoanaerobaculaceae bacterium]
MAKKLMKGCEAIGEAAIHAGCRLFFGYPITPQNEIPEYMSARLPQVGGVFLQAESEVAASNMLYGAAGAGCRVFTSSSSPGISLMAEAISYIAGAELPVVIVNIMRGGPGLGGILPSQSDYFQATKGGGHGDYRVLVLAPSTVQEAADLTQDAFDLADHYRNPVMVVGDGLIGQMMEPVEFKRSISPEELPAKPWATTGCSDRKPNIINSLFLNPEELEAHNWHLHRKYQDMAREIRWESWKLEEPVDVLIVAYGTVARICKTAIDTLRARGVKVGLFRPISLFPYPSEQLSQAVEKAGKVLVTELSTGQMLEDVQAIVAGRKPVSFYGRVGGMVMSPEEIEREVDKLVAS